MSGTVFTILALLFGIGIAMAGGMYLKKTWDDRESRKIYSVFLGIGLAVVVGVAIKIAVAGF